MDSLLPYYWDTRDWLLAAAVAGLLGGVVSTWLFLVKITRIGTLLNESSGLSVESQRRRND
jgi:hypothetical protein